ncbi:MAG TPA: helix-turn-helix transcriptional regulator [Microbacteriaceae bacterium]|nr:helix-turn-helix transcriptional regulator [Microbacteriaceae bacterium]
MKRVEDWEADLGRQIRALRIAAGLDQAALAGASNASLSAVKALEAGRGSSLKTLIRVVRALDREDWLEELDPAGDGPTPMDLLRAERGRSTPQRVRRR